MSGLCFEVPPTSREKIEALTASIRNHFRIIEPFFPLVEMVELWLPRVWPEFEYSIGSHEEMGDDHGRTFPGQHHIRLREDVHANLQHHRGRDRFTLGHELGHVFMHDNPALARNLRRQVDIPAYRSSEWQANAFAASLLMPLEFLNNARGINEVIERCGVTAEAVTTQIRGMRNAGLLRNAQLG